MMIIAFSACFATRLAPAPPLVLRALKGLGKLWRCREVAPPIGGNGVALVAVLVVCDLRGRDETLKALHQHSIEPIVGFIRDHCSFG